MGNAASGLPFVVGEEVPGYPEGSESYWRLHRGKKRVRVVVILRRVFVSAGMATGGYSYGTKAHERKHTCWCCCFANRPNVWLLYCVVPLP